MLTPRTTPESLSFLDRPGRAAELIKTFDWKASPLGDLPLWPQSLKTAVGMVLGSGQACNLIWGAHRITFYNDAYRPLLGSCLPDGIGLPFPIFRSDIWPFVEERIEAGFAGEATTAENMRVLTRRYGDAEEAFFMLHCSPVYDEASAVAGVLSFLHETTNTVRSQRALANENERLRRGLNHLPQMIWSALPDGYHDFYNDPWYEFTGVEPGSTDGDGWKEMFHPDDRERAQATWRHSLRTGEPYMIQYRLKHRGGEHRWTLGRASPERDDSGKIIRWYGSCTDIHEQVLGQQKLQSLQAELLHLSRISAMGSMAATLAHEVNQPLAAAASFAAGLRRQLGTEGSTAMLLEGISGVEEAVLRAGDIIRRLREMVQGQGPRREKVEVAGLVRGACHILRDACSKVVLEFDVEEGATVACDSVQIQQVLTNLIRNACEAVEGDDEARITITVRSDGQSVRVGVIDNGPGLEPGSEKTIFDALRPSKKGGMGIGLAISRTIVEAHGGTIIAENRMPRGASFFFELPTSAAIEKDRPLPLEPRREPEVQENVGDGDRSSRSMLFDRSR